ncbi:hypothetical protein NIES2109_59580 (plasmid) [Nostoc sp. HK-01]|nr:hypothetical protein NIES2109_59580 [Nostoc sp. HK-01]
MVESSETCRELIMLELNIVASVNWNATYGERLREMRGKVPMQRLADEVSEKYGYRVTKQYIQMLERPFGEKASKTVSFILLRYICAALGNDVQSLFGSPKIIEQNK